MCRPYARARRGRTAVDASGVMAATLSARAIGLAPICLRVSGRMGHRCLSHVGTSCCVHRRVSLHRVTGIDAGALAALAGAVSVPGRSGMVTRTLPCAVMPKLARLPAGNGTKGAAAAARTGAAAAARTGAAAAARTGAAGERRPPGRSARPRALAAGPRDHAGAPWDSCVTASMGPLRSRAGSPASPATSSRQRGHDATCRPTIARSAGAIAEHVDAQLRADLRARAGAAHRDASRSRRSVLGTATA